ncbi:pectin methylesterase-like acyl-CoA thioesterase [Kribbella sp. VKM Ac-2527]|uniref:Pectin methylesterase-like acyl-CoA thioesterase n=1 Tax=Kribbella caucasensis TaxID=2512215 RepID=A0A4R6KNB1_9ACTN|nr:pectinesterase family protein [Kribbella sp. VKM Ac-2527]TDO52466.1 pectin methylesterase-like acyl-CoA thioesterase [Kribbella sp. VKM Ac-2527]
MRITAHKRPVRLHAVSLCLTLILGLAAFVAPSGTAATAANPATFGPFDPRIELDGHWGRDDDVAITVNSGSSLRFRFTGDRLGAWFDTESITVPAQLYVSVDRADPVLSKVDEDHKIFVEGLDPTVAHTAEIMVKDVDEYANRWIMPLQSGVVLEKIELAPAATLIPLPTTAEHRIEFYGDSITQGVMALCPQLGTDCADGTKSYPHLVGNAFGADTNQVGFGKQGIVQPGHGNVGTAAESFGWNLAGFPAASFDPGAVVVNFGTNDAPYPSSEFTPKYLAYLRQIRAASPPALIFALRPFNGTHAADIAAAVAATKDRRIVYVDTTGWLGPDDYNGTTHPNVKGHQVAAAKLTKVLERLTGWTTTRPSTPVLSPRGTADPTCSDTTLKLTFQGPVQLGVKGKLRIHRAGGEVVDTIDLADLTSYQRFIGDARSDFGQLHTWTYQAVTVDGRTVSIHQHQRLAPGQVYYVTVDPGFVAGHPGIAEPSRWMFRTRHDPATDSRVTVGGRGDFCTVQGAIDFVAEGNKSRIDVAPGLYRELVYVPQTKPGITIVGAGAGRTIIGYPNNNLLNGDYAMGGVPIEQAYCPRRVLAQPDRFNCWRAAMGVDADDFTLTDATVQNLTPYRGSQAEAFRGNGERIVLARVRILGYQDSLRLQGKGFVTDSYIEGDVDFVWGTGGVFLQDSELKALHAGYVNQVRNSDNGPGNIFVNVRLTRGPDAPDDSVFLGRVELNRFPTSQVVFIDSAMDAHVKKAGFQITNPNDCAAAGQVRFWEYRSTDLSGRPLDTSARLACSRQLSDDEAAWLRDPSNVFGGWQPVVPRPER